MDRGLILWIWDFTVLLHPSFLLCSGTCSLVFALGGVEAVSEGDSIGAHGPLAQLSDRVGLAVYHDFC